MLSAHCFPSRFHDSLAVSPYFFSTHPECPDSAYVLDAHVLHYAGNLLGYDLRDANSKAGIDQVLLRDHDGPGLAGGPHDSFAVERLDGVYVDDAGGDCLRLPEFPTRESLRQPSGRVANIVTSLPSIQFNTFADLELLVG